MPLCYKCVKRGAFFARGRERGRVRALVISQYGIFYWGLRGAEIIGA